MRLWILFLVIPALFVAKAVGAADVLYFTSSPTSWVGHGQTLSLSSDTGWTIQAFRFGYTFGKNANTLNFRAVSPVDSWDLYLLAPGYSLPTVGSYQPTRPWNSQDAGAGLTFEGEGRADDDSYGSFQVLESVFDANGNVQKYAADFV